MKTNFIPSILLLLAITCILSCSKMDATYKDLVKPNGINYIGRADSVKTYSGRNRIKITWIKGTDPKINQACIYWNNKADSILVPIGEYKTNDTVAVIIDGLPESSYTFYIYTLDTEGNTSIRVDAMGNSYGQAYESALLIRPIETAVSVDKNAIITWFAADKTEIAVELLYSDNSNIEHQIFIPRDSMGTMLKNFKEGTIRYRSLFRPDTLCLDTFYTAYDSVKVEAPIIPDVNLALDQKVVDKSSDASAGRATNVTDGDYTSMWQPLSGDRSDLNTYVTIDLGSTMAFNAVDLFYTKGAGQLTGYEILYSDDNATWQTAYSSMQAPGSTEKISFPTVSGRYIKLSQTLSSSGANVNLSELEVYNR